MTITPNQARQLLQGTTPGPWEKTQDGLTHPTGYTIDGVLHDCCDYQGVVDDPNADLICAAPDMAATLAHMRWEYRIEEWIDGPYEWSPITPWYSQPLGESGSNERIVRRLVSEAEVVP